jgi:hypothetical protein
VKRRKQRDWWFRPRFVKDEVMKTPHVVIVGAGLGGCVVADALAENCRVTVVAHPPGAAGPVDVGRPAMTEPHVGLGLGGTTRFWHNGLRAMEAHVWRHWPWGPEVLAPFMPQAWHLLGGRPPLLRANQHGPIQDSAQLRLGNPLFYPTVRRNLWRHLGLAQRVTQVAGAVKPLAAKDGVVQRVEVLTAEGLLTIPVDAVVVSAGGLGSPLVLQNLSPHVGRWYEDHPTVQVARVTLNTKIFSKLWNQRVTGGAWRQPFEVLVDGVPLAFYLRPAPPTGYMTKRQQVCSVLSDVRNYPLRWGNYWRLLQNGPDLLDVLSLKLRLNWPTPHYDVWLVGGVTTASAQAVQGHPGGLWQRDWQLPEEYQAIVQQGLAKFQQALGPMVLAWHELTSWWEYVQSSAHHSGTCRMGNSSDSSVCDPNGQVWGTNNVWVADGSLIPASGTANTGLTIAALALRTAQQMQTQMSQKAKPMPTTPEVDIVMSGATGNVGRQLVPLLRARGLVVEDVTTFTAHEKTARWFVHLANIHAQPAANMALFDELDAQLRSRVEGTLVTMTFASLMGIGRLDVTQPNCGFKPWCAGIYTVGKMLLEQHLLRRRVWPLTLVYLPAVVAGPDSHWARMLKQAKMHGYVLPWWWPMCGRPNHITVEDLADWLVQHGQAPIQPGVQRVVLNTPSVADTTWEDLLGSKRLRWAPHGRRWWLVQVRSLLQNILLAEVYHMGLFMPLWERLKGRARPLKAEANVPGPVPAGPVLLDGEAGLQVALQGYLSAP